jgi:hypothetical protein
VSDKSALAEGVLVVEALAFGVGARDELQATIESANASEPRDREIIVIG